MKFTLKIHTENEAMQTRADVARNLRELSPHLNEYSDAVDSGPIHDDNGNTVGEWTIDARVPCAGGCGRMMDPAELAENATDCCPDCQGTDRDPDPWAQRDPDELHNRNR